MRVQVTLTIEVGDEAYADAITYNIHQYGNDTSHLAENPTDADTAEAVESVLLDVLNNELGECAAVAHWTVTSATCEVTG